MFKFVEQCEENRFVEEASHVELTARLAAYGVLGAALENCNVHRERVVDQNRFYCGVFAHNSLDIENVFIIFFPNLFRFLVHAFLAAITVSVVLVLILLRVGQVEVNFVGGYLAWLAKN